MAVFLAIVVLSLGWYARKLELFAKQKHANIPCPDYWVSFGNSCYKFSKVKAPWFHAMKNCSDEGGYLVSIESEQENKFLINTLKQLWTGQSTTTVGYWTSGNDLAVEGTWTWGFPEGDLFSYTNWYPGEPNNHDHHEVTSEECMQLWGYKNFAWNDIICTEMDYFICEIQ